MQNISDSVRKPDATETPAKSPFDLIVTSRATHQIVNDLGRVARRQEIDGCAKQMRLWTATDLKFGFST